jgi:hypothetical protein
MTGAALLEAPETLVAVPDRGRRRRRRPPDRVPAASLRFAAFAALVVYGCEHWVRQVAPTPRGVALQMAGVAIAAAVAFGLASRLPRPRTRRLALAALGLAAGVLALTAAGIPLRFAGWRNWGELIAGVGEGITALPNLNVPYRGLDPWVRWTILSGAALLCVLAGALAFAGKGAPAASARRRAGAALALGALYGVPVVERNPESPFLSGAGFAVLLALFLGADRLTGIAGARPRLIAAGGALAALGLAAVLAPQLDGERPWVDYRGLAGDLGERSQSAFNWNHSYSPLDWPRDGREVLRVRARRPAYWKATVLRRFDGIRWVRDEAFAPALIDTPRPAAEAGWYHDIQVTVRSLRSQEYVAAGFTSEIRDVPRPAAAAGSGTWTTAGRALRPGDTYRASIYTPRPTQAQLAAAGTAYPEYVVPDLALELPEDVGGPGALGRPSPRGPQVTTLVFPRVRQLGAADDLHPGPPAVPGR